MEIITNTSSGVRASVTIRLYINTCIGHFEKAPFNPSTMRSVYHMREIDTFKVRLVKQPLDIFISHDWPRNITDHGNVDQLLRVKSFFEREVIRGKPYNIMLIDDIDTRAIIRQSSHRNNPARVAAWLLVLSAFARQVPSPGQTSVRTNNKVLSARQVFASS